MNLNSLENMAKKKFDNVLDIAGGSGRIAIPLKDISKKTTVLDINSNALRILKERESTFHLICSDFIKFKIEDKFSLILCIEAIDNFYNWEEFFNKISSLLLNDGRFIFTYINPNSWRFLLRKIKHLKNGPTKYNEVKFNDLLKILDKNNLVIDKMEGMNWIPLSLSSNSILVHLFEFIEDLFRLKKWYSQSPWILISIKKVINDQ